MTLPNLTRCAFAAAMLAACLLDQAFAQEVPVRTLPAPNLPEIRPPKLASDEVELPLPGTCEDLVVGGGGRYLCLKFGELNKVGIFDVNTASIENYVSFSDPDTFIAAGAEDLILVSDTNKSASRYSLATGERGLSRPLNAPEKIGVVALGSSSSGPLLVGFGSGHPLHVQHMVLSPQDLQPLGWTVPKQFRVTFERGAVVRASANGQTFSAWRTGVSPSGVSALVFQGHQGEQFYEHQSSGHLMPSPDGRWIYSGAGIYNHRIVLRSRDNTRVMIPAVHGPLALGLASDRNTYLDNPSEVNTTLHADQDPTPLASLPFKLTLHSSRSRSQNQLTAEKQNILIPNADLVVSVDTTGTKLKLHRLGLSSLLESSTRDYFFVSSEPKLVAERGQAYQYQVIVQSKANGVTYRLDHGPEGMKIDARSGQITWDVPKWYPEDECTVILSLRNPEGKMIYHTYRLGMSGEKSGMPPSDRQEPPAEAAIDPETLKVHPARLQADTEERLFPDMATDVQVGGAGRFLILKFEALGVLGVFDISAAQITHYMPLEHPDAKYAAGATKLVQLDPVKKVLTRYNLITGARELSVPISLEESNAILLGSASEGPIFVFSGASYRGSIEAIDLKRLSKIPFNSPTVRDILTNPHALPNGQGFVVAGRQVTIYQWNGQELIAKPSEIGASYALPSQDGRYFATNVGLLNADLAKTVASPSILLPAVGGNLYLVADRSSNSYDSVVKNIGIHSLGNGQRLHTITDLASRQMPVQTGQTRALPIEKRMFVASDAEVMMMIPNTDDRFIIDRFNLPQVLEKAGYDYLFVDSLAPLTAKPGETYQYKPVVRSKRGGVKLRLETGPEGMTLQNDTIRWPVPANIDEPRESAVLAVSDASGQETFYSFVIQLPDVREKEPEASTPTVAANPPAVVPPIRRPTTPVPPSVPTSELLELRRFIGDIQQRQRTDGERLIAMEQSLAERIVQSEANQRQQSQELAAKLTSELEASRAQLGTLEQSLIAVRTDSDSLSSWMGLLMAFSVGLLLLLVGALALSIYSMQRFSRLQVELVRLQERSIAGSMAPAETVGPQTTAGSTAAPAVRQQPRPVRPTPIRKPPPRA